MFFSETGFSNKAECSDKKLFTRLFLEVQRHRTQMGFLLHKQTSGGRHKMPPCKRQVVMICRWGHGARQKMEARASLFRGQCTHSYQPGGRLRTLRNVSRQGVRVWGEYCAIVTLDLTVWHWLFLPPVGPLCLIPVGAHNRATVYSVNNIKCIEWLLFSHCDMWFRSSCPRRRSRGSVCKRLDRKLTGLNSPLWLLSKFWIPGFDWDP